MQLLWGITTLSFLLSSTSAANLDTAAEVQHVERDGSVMIRFGPNNYALAGPLFAAWQWKTISINGGTTNIWSPDCRTMSTTLEQMSEGARTEIKRVLNQLEGGGQASSIATTGNNQYLSISRPGLPNKLVRVIVSNDLVCFIYHDKRVELKPKDCLEENEKYLVKQLQQESSHSQHRVEENLKQLRNDMNKNIGNLRQMMESMRSNLGKMFNG